MTAIATEVPRLAPSDDGTAPDVPREPPRVSIGLPVYNGEDYLAQAVDSILAQEYADFELVVSDNGSTDATEAICREYASRDPRIRYHREERNRGAAWNFNHVVRMARGEFFRWACHDDAISPSHLRRCVEVLEDAPPSVVLAYTRSVLVDADGNAVGTFEDGLDTRGMPPHERFRLVARRLRYTHVLYGLIRREALMGTRLLGAYESSDNVLVAELSLAGEFVEIPAYLFRRRIHARMSRKANTSARSVAQWFDPSADARFYFPHARLFGEYTRAVWRAPLARGERMRTALALRHWARREVRPFILGVLSPVLRHSPATSQ
ncbi:MAG: glycosyltransferase [Dehalococcoidia bacterium]|nr:glycosyltransferase [Dehalococcoidia bacterium]